MESQLQTILKDGSKSKDDYTLEIFRIISFEPDFHFKMHSHKRIELNYILKGSCVMMLDNKLVKLNQNNSILIFPGSKHDFYVNSNHGVKIVQLEFLLDYSASEDSKDLLEPELSFLYCLKSSTKNYIKIPNNPEIGNCMERIIRENKLKRNNFCALSRIYFLELIILISRFINKHDGMINRQDNEYLKIAMNRIHSNYHSEVYVSELAKECNISERYLRKLFTKNLDSTPQQYCNNVRINKAVELLADRNIPINEIAFRIGYSTPQYFSRMFKSKYGFSPQKYRKILFETKSFE